MFKVLVDNFLGFDFIIFLLAGLNVFILVKTTFYAKKLYLKLNPYSWIPGGEASLREIQEKFARRRQMDSETDIIRLRRKTSTYYVFYENLTAIFPLMGLLGTVVSLLPMVEEMGDVATGLFFSALTSTMWGIIFAIIFKAMNGYICAQIEDNEKNIEVYLQRNTNRLVGEEQTSTKANESVAVDEPTKTTVAAKANEPIVAEEPAKTTVADKANEPVAVDEPTGTTVADKTSEQALADILEEAAATTEAAVTADGQEDSKGEL